MLEPTTDIGTTDIDGLPPEAGHPEYPRWSNVNWREGIPLALFHLGALLPLWVGVSWPAVIACFVVYWIQIFGVSAGYHRYFAHRSFKTSRVFQFVLAFLGGLSAQMGPIWWSSHHRRHHKHADEEEDLHSPTLSGFLWSHIGWIMARDNSEADPRYVPDLLRYPELRWIDRHRYVPPMTLMGVLALIGWGLAAWAPQWGTGPLQMLAWGSFVATTICYQITFCVNSVTHLWGRRRFATGDNSRNHWLLALLTNGEGWHNNHHRYPGSARQGFFWWEWDLTLYILRGLRALGIVWDIHEPPARVYAEVRSERAS